MSSQDLFTQDVVMTPQESELPSGIRSSEIDLSYSELSSVEPTSTQFGTAVNVDDNQTTIDGTSRHVIYGTEVNVGILMEKFKTFLLEYKSQDLDQPFVSDLEFDSNQPYYIQKMQDLFNTNQNWIDINGNHLKSFCNPLFQNLIAFPREVIPSMDKVTCSVFQSKFGELRQLETRPFNCGDLIGLRDLSERNVDQIVSINGLVFRISEIIPEVTVVAYQCNECNFIKTLTCDSQVTIQPESCTNCHQKFTMEIEHNLNKSIDKQFVRLQESPNDMPAGQTPQTITLVCYNNLVDMCKPGDRVIATGIYRVFKQRTNFNSRLVKSVANTHVEVLNIRKITSGINFDKNELKPERINEIKQFSTKPDVYERLSSAIAPNIYGNEDIKKALLLQLIGGCKNKNGNRGDIHILLCGDPGTAKSQLLKYSNQISPRSQYTSGKGASGAGLTAYITRDEDTHLPVLQAGSLVLADQGLCCIDEFDKMTESTRSALHEVMEQQTFSVAKAGVICELNARTSIVAASNPVGSKWDMRKTIVENIKLPPTLLSRFDLIFLMLNPQDSTYHAKLARHIISLYGNNQDTSMGYIGDGYVDFNFLKDYISYAKQITPTMTEDAENYIIEEYVSMRSRQGSNKGQVTAYPRQLESLKRMSQALAKLRLSSTVDIEDSKEARRLQLEALKQAAVDPSTGLIDVSILTTGMSGSESAKKRREELSDHIMALLQAKTSKTHNYQKVLDETRQSAEVMISRELFEDTLNLLRINNRIQWANKLIRVL